MEPFPLSGYIDDSLPSGMIQEQPPAALMGSEPLYINSGIDLVSGKPMSVLETGSCPENILGDTAPQPVTFEIADIPGSKNDVG